MRKILFLLLILPTTLSAERKHVFDYRFDVPIDAPLKRSIESVLSYVSSRITYWEADLTDASFWHYPAETMRQMAGDCKDYSSLTVQILFQKGIEAHFIGAEIRDRRNGRRSSHAFIKIGETFFEPQRQDGTIDYDIVRIFWDWDYETMKQEILLRRNNAPSF